MRIAIEHTFDGGVCDCHELGFGRLPAPAGFAVAATAVVLVLGQTCRQDSYWLFVQNSRVYACRLQNSKRNWAVSTFNVR